MILAAVVCTRAVEHLDRYYQPYTFGFLDENGLQSVISVTSFYKDKRWPQMVRVVYFFFASFFPTTQSRVADLRLAT